MSATRVATTTAARLVGRAHQPAVVHFAAVNRSGVVFACNGRTVSAATIGAGAVTCSTCHAAKAAGRVLLEDAAAAEART